MIQGSLFEEKRSIQERFEDYDKRHPEVYSALVSLCFELYRKGWRHCGIRFMWERMRWYFQVEKDLGEEFKLNDHYHSRYVRKIIKDHPELDGFFELRELKAE